MFRLPVLLVALVTSSCLDDTDPFKQIGYFKGDNRNRVFLIQATEPVTEDQIAEYAKGLMNTAGRFTMAFIYADPNAEMTDPVTAAPDYMAAIDRMYQSRLAPWDYRTVVDATGAFSIRNCRIHYAEPECKNGK